MQTLFTPWRYRYITAKGPAPDCFLCRAAAAEDDPESLVVHAAEHHVVLLNRHPYTNGHLMVAPRAHLADPSAASGEAVDELWPLVLRARDVLRSVYRPDGFNLGMNLGGTAGAGVPEHFHFHVVPRWDGDTSFLSVVGGVRTIPEDLQDTWGRVRSAFGRGA